MNESPLLYHYTNGKALTSILEHGELWATHIQFLNDAKEFLHAIDIAEEGLAEMRRAPAFGNQQNLLERLQGELTNLKVMNESGVIDVFVASFSSVADDLSQWRGYCSKGNGYCVGFDRLGIEKLTQTKDNLSLCQCIYKREEQQAALEGLVTGVSEHDESSIESFNEKFVELAPRLKNDKFINEGEWRLVLRRGAPTRSTWRFDADPEGSLFTVSFRPGRSTLIPYAKIDLCQQPSASTVTKTLPIKELWIGPTSEMQLSLVATWKLLHHSGYTPEFCSINKSLVPYRDW
jgi:hypothetical protein